MKYLFYYIWIGLIFWYRLVSKIFIPINWILIKTGIKTKEDQEEWRKNYNKAILEFPGGINDWFALAFLLAFIYGVILAVLFYFDKYTMAFLKSDILFIGSIIGIAIFCYYWIYFKNIEWLKDRIRKVQKKYYV